MEPGSRSSTRQGYREWLLRTTIIDTGLANRDRPRTDACRDVAIIRSNVTDFRDGLFAWSIDSSRCQRLFLDDFTRARIGLAFAGYSVGVALKTRNAQAAQAGTLLFFPLIFLSTTFVPKDLIEAEWLKIAATINPTTYIMEGMRSVLTRSEIDWSVYWQGLIVAAVLSIAMVIFAALNARGALKVKKWTRF